MPIETASCFAFESRVLDGGPILYAEKHFATALATTAITVPMVHCSRLLVQCESMCAL